MCFGSPGPSEFFLRYATGMPWPWIVWKDAEQGLGMAMSTMLPWQLFIATCFANGDISGCVFSLVFQRDDLLKKSLILIPSKKPDFAMAKN